MLSGGLECFLEGWNAFDSVGIPLYRVGILSAGLEYICTGFKCFLEGWNAFDIAGIPVYRAGIPLYRAGIPLYRAGMLYRGVQCFLQSWNAFCRVGMLSTELKYLCTGLKCFR
jgi:hypothetical protein